MKNFHQIILGFGAALLSIFLVLGSFSIAFTEGGMAKVALQLTEPVTPLPTQVLPSTSVPLPGVTSTAAPLTVEETSPVISETPPPEVLACAFPPGWFKITVQMGDTLNTLAVAYGTTTEMLVQGNCLVINNLIAGMVLFVPAAPTTTPEETCGPPPGWVYYTVQYGDTLYSISQMVGTSVFDLQLANCMVGQTNIRAGQRLLVPFVPVSAMSPTPTQVYTATPVPSQTPYPATPTTSVEATWTPTQSIPPNQTPTPTVSPVPEDTSTPTATVILTSTPTNLPTSTPSQTPLPTEMPTPSQTLEPTGGPVVP
jgi:LysM repeat protein